MIGFYTRGFATVWAAATRLREWRRRHPRWSIVIAIAAVNAVFVVFSTSYAWAADGGGPLAPFLPGGTLHDSAGVAVVNYSVLPLDRGDAFTPLKAIPTTLIDMIWTYHLAFVAWMLWFLEWLLNFEWVAWIAEPFNALAVVVQDLLGQVAWIPLALAVTGLVAGTALLAGKYAAGFLELLISAVCVVLATGLLANPVATLTATGGALDKAQDYSAEVAAAVVSDRGKPSSVGGDVLSESVTTQLVDIFVRLPAQTVTFGHTLTGQCATIFNDTMNASAPVAGGENEVRDRVGECDPAAKNYVENPNFGAVFAAATIATGGTALYGFAVIVAALLIVTVIFFLIAALKTMWNVYLGMLPVNRYPLWRSLGDVATGLISIFVIVVAIAAYLKILVDVLLVTSSMGIIAQMMFVNIVMIVLMILLWRIRSTAKKAGRSLAEQLSRVGLQSGGARQNDRALGAAAMSTVVSSGMNLIGRRKPTPAVSPIDARSINIFGMPGRGSAVEDIGEMTTVRPPVPPSGPSASTRGVRPRQALSAGNGPSSGSTLAQKTGKNADLIFKAVNVAKAAPGGPGAVAGAAALEVGKGIATSAATKAIASSAQPTAKRRPTERPSAVQPPAPAETSRPSGRRIIVGSDGTGHIQRTKLGPVYDISTLPPQQPTAPRSSRNTDLRDLIASRKQPV